MTDLLFHIPLLGFRVVAALTLVGLAGVALAVVARHSAGWRRTGAVVAVVGLLAAGAAAVNTRLYAYPTVGSLTGTPQLPMVDRLHPTSNVEFEQGAAARISVPDTRSHFGVFDAQVYLPPQYFREPERRFPVVVLTHGNPGASTDWLERRVGGADRTGRRPVRPPGGPRHADRPAGAGRRQPLRRHRLAGQRRDVRRPGRRRRRGLAAADHDRSRPPRHRRASRWAGSAR